MPNPRANIRQLHPREVTAANISLIPRHNLEAVFLERERTRDLAIGIAFVAGGLFGGIVTVLLLGWLS